MAVIEQFGELSTPEDVKRRLVTENLVTLERDGFVKNMPLYTAALY